MKLSYYYDHFSEADGSIFYELKMEKIGFKVMAISLIASFLL